MMRELRRLSWNRYKVGTVVAVLLALVVVPSAHVAAQERVLGRLFTSPSERAILDKSRHRAINTVLSAAHTAPAQEVPATKLDVPAALPPPAPAPALIRFSGYISRGNTPVAVWSQGSDSESKLVADVDKSGNAVFRVESRSAGIEIKPGQILYPREKLTTEAYLARAVEPVAPLAKTPASEIKPGQGD